MRHVLWLVMLAACGRTVVYRPPQTLPSPTLPDAGVIVKPCETGPVPLSHTTPSIFFVIDRSGSMAFDLKGNEGPPFGDPLEGPSRWNILSDVMREVLPAHDHDLAMGAMLFPTNNECALSAEVDLTPRVGASSAILSLFDEREPGGGTPIAAAMNAMRTPAMKASAKSLILITDGEPNCNAMLDPFSCTCTQAPIGFPAVCPEASICLDDQRTVQSIEQLHADGGVITHVVGFATATRAAVTLDAMAVAGGAPRMGAHKFNSAETKAELQDVLTGISARETDCTWTALTRLKPDDLLEVKVDGNVVPEGSGWEWLQREQGSFVLRSGWCDLVLGGATVTARLTCRQ